METNEMTINEARQEIVTIATDFSSVLTISQMTALLLSEQALKTIEDMQTKGEHSYD